jgi:Tfp pilus assembly protein PilE
MKGYSFYELLITVIVVATLCALSLSHYSVQRERTLDGEAQTNLAIIIGAERDFRRQGTLFLDSNNEAPLNTNLVGVLLPTANRQWAYSTTQDAANLVCCAQAERMPLPGRIWRLCTNGNQPVLGSCGASAVNCP